MSDRVYVGKGVRRRPRGDLVHAWPAMRVTLVAPLVSRLRAAQIGGSQAVVADLARGLTERGLDVELVAAPGSAVPGVRLRRAPGGPFGAELLRSMPAARGAGSQASTSWPSAQAATYLRLASDLRSDPVPPDVV